MSFQQNLFGVFPAPRARSRDAAFATDFAAVDAAGKLAAKPGEYRVSFGV